MAGNRPPFITPRVVNSNTIPLNPPRDLGKPGFPPRQMERIHYAEYPTSHNFISIEDSGRYQRPTSGYILFRDNGPPDELRREGGMPYGLLSLALVNILLREAYEAVSKAGGNLVPKHIRASETGGVFDKFRNATDDAAYGVLTENEKILTERGVLERFNYLGVVRGNEQDTRGIRPGFLVDYKRTGNADVVNYLFDTIIKPGVFVVLSIKRVPLDQRGGPGPMQFVPIGLNSKPISEDLSSNTNTTDEHYFSDASTGNAMTPRMLIPVGMIVGSNTKLSVIGNRSLCDGSDESLSLEVNAPATLLLWLGKRSQQN